jgi:homocysteine S-methyltransferase
MEEQLADSILTIDGGLATEIENKGYNLTGDPLWSARCLHNRPDLIRGVHLDFLRAGADVIITSSYQACVNGFCKELGVSEDEAKDLLRLSVRLAVEARDVHLQENPGRRDRPPLIAGSVGPFGAYNSPDAAEYHGNYVDSMSVEDLKRWHTSRIECLLSEKVDILAIETIPAQVEAEAVVGLLRDYPNARAWVTFSCRNGKETCHGENFAKACSVVSKSEQVLAVGVNCTSPLYVEDLLLSAKGTTGSKPFIVYPNSGEMYSEKK